MTKNLVSKKWIQIGIVQGGVGECGDKDYPGIYIRLNHPLVLDFITSVVESKTTTIPKGNEGIGSVASHPLCLMLLGC